MVYIELRLAPEQPCSAINNLLYRYQIGILLNTATTATERPDQLLIKPMLTKSCSWTFCVSRAVSLHHTSTSR